jgi:hypothetical protein
MYTLKKIILALIAVVVTTGVLWQTNRTVSPREVSWPDVQVEARQGGYQIIAVDDLWERYRLNPESLLLVDTRQEWEFRMGHIEGAENFPLEPTWLSRWQQKGALKTFLGPDKERLIIFY